MKHILSIGQLPLQHSAPPQDSSVAGTELPASKAEMIPSLGFEQAFLGVLKQAEIRSEIHSDLLGPATAGPSVEDKSVQVPQADLGFAYLYAPAEVSIEELTAMSQPLKTALTALKADEGELVAMTGLDSSTPEIIVKAGQPGAMVHVQASVIAPPDAMGSAVPTPALVEHRLHQLGAGAVPSPSNAEPQPAVQRDQSVARVHPQSTAGNEGNPITSVAESTPARDNILPTGHRHPRAEIARHVVSQDPLYSPGLPISSVRTDGAAAPMPTQTLAGAMPHDGAPAHLPLGVQGGGQVDTGDEHDPAARLTTGMVKESRKAAIPPTGHPEEGRLKRQPGASAVVTDRQETTWPTRPDRRPTALTPASSKTLDSQLKSAAKTPLSATSAGRNEILPASEREQPASIVATGSRVKRLIEAGSPAMPLNRSLPAIAPTPSASQPATPEVAIPLVESVSSTAAQLRSLPPLILGSESHLPRPKLAPNAPGLINIAELTPRPDVQRADASATNQRTRQDPAVQAFSAPPNVRIPGNAEAVGNSLESLLLLTPADRVTAQPSEVSSPRAMPPTPPLQISTFPAISRQLIDVAQRHPERPMELVLAPEELGRLRMSFMANEGNLQVTILAERNETMSLLRRNIDALAQEFRDIGYDQLQLDIGAENHGEQESEQLTEAESDVAPDIDENAPVETPTPVQIALGGMGGLDLRL